MPTRVISCLAVIVEEKSLLRHVDRPDARRYVTPASTFDFAAFKVRKKLRVEAAVSALDAVVCGRRPRIPYQFFTEFSFKQPRPYLFSGCWQIEWNGNVGIVRPQRFIIELQRQMVKPI